MPKKQPVIKQTPSISEEQLNQLREIMPQVFTEGKVDFEKLHASLGDFGDERPERYSFSWAGKRDAIRILQTPSRATLIPARKESIDFDKTQNIFIEGDNLEVLKLLYKPYFGQVKMIYIDPPYNTGNDFVYPDNFADPLDTYLKLTGQKDSEGNLLTSNAETGGRYHSTWLSMMYPRLFLARQLLTDDGVIFVSIDDHEFSSLQLLLNEIFGEEGFVSTFVWRRRISSSLASSWVSADHEYVIGYSKNPEAVYVRGDERDMAKYSIPDGNGRFYASMPLTVGMTKAMRPNQWYKLINPKTGTGYWPPEGRVWGYYPPTMEQKIKEDKIIWPEDFPDRKLSTPRLKTYPEDAKRDRKPISTWILEKNSKEAIDEDVYNISSAKNEEGTRVLKELLGDSSFSYPKPISLLKSLVDQFTKDDDLILDFFAGSGTLAHATLEINSELNGKRRFILVQLQEPTGNKEFPTIAEICKERVRRVIKKIKKENDNQSGDLGFKVFKLRETNYKQWDSTEQKDPKVYAKQMEMLADPLVKGWKEEDVLYEVALKEGYGLNVVVEDTNVKGIQKVSDPDKAQGFYLCLADKVKVKDVKALNLKKDDLFICRDIALDDETAANLSLQCRLKTI